MRVYLDANFFISGFSERPKDVAIVKEAAANAGMELWITRQVFQELRWYLRREVEKIVQIDDALSHGFTGSEPSAFFQLKDENETEIDMAYCLLKRSVYNMGLKKMQ